MSWNTNTLNGIVYLSESELHDLLQEYDFSRFSSCLKRMLHQMSQFNQDTDGLYINSSAVFSF